MPPFTACVVQTPSYPYDKAGNLQRALDTMETAALGTWKNAASSSVPVRPSACSMTSASPSMSNTPTSP